jgi:4-amino-4-deoxy-L-arabinose transferase-like glycosyltransferase
MDFLFHISIAQHPSSGIGVSRLSQGFTTIDRGEHLFHGADVYLSAVRRSAVCEYYRDGFGDRGLSVLPVLWLSRLLEALDVALYPDDAFDIFVVRLDPADVRICHRVLTERVHSLTDEPVEKKSSAFLMLCLVLLTLGFRVVHLAADPPADFDWSGGYFADEGYWSHNARNQVLFGNPLQDDWDARVVSPVFPVIQTWIFRLLGVGLVQSRIIGLVSALALSMATFLLLRRQYEETVAFLCAVLVSLNYPLVILARQGIPDPFAAALAWLALMLVCRESRLSSFSAGIVMIGAAVTKFFLIYAFAPILVAMWLGADTKRRNQLILFFAAGTAAAAAVWFLANYLPNREILLGYNRYYSNQQNWAPAAMLKSVLLQPAYLYFVKTPAMLVFGNLLFWYFLSHPARMRGLEKALWSWLLCGVLFFAVWKYRPLRYYTSLFPAVAILAGLSLFRIQSLADGFAQKKSRAWMLLGIAIPFAQIAFVLADRLFGWNFVPSQLGIRTLDALTLLVLSAGVVFVLSRAQQKAKWMTVLFFAGFLFSDLRNELRWMLYPQFAAREIAADLEQQSPKAIVSGQWAPEMVLDNRLRAVPVWKGFVNSEKPFERFQITHLLLWRYPLGDELQKFQEWYPEDMKEFRLLKTYRIKDSDLDLYVREK